MNRLAAIAALAIAAGPALAETGEGERRRPPEPEREETREPAPRPDQSSGIAVPRPRQKSLLGPILAIPRIALSLLLEGPERLAAELDEHLESQGPNSLGRGQGGPWSYGVIGRWETALGPSAGALVGYRATSWLDAGLGVAALGRYGQTGILRFRLGSHTRWALAPSISVVAGRDRDRIFRGIGDGSGCPDPGAATLDPSCRGPRATYDEDTVRTHARLNARAGALGFAAQIGGEWTENRDGGESPLGDRYDAAALAGFGAFHAVRTELAVSYDGRDRRYEWIHPMTPSSGTRARLAAGYVAGSIDGGASFGFPEIDASAEHLVDLFRGNRVLVFAARVHTLVVGDDTVPFSVLPSLGGSRALRALPMAEVRDRGVAHAEVRYRWALGLHSSASLFVEAGDGFADLDGIEPSWRRSGGGVRIRFLGDSADRLSLTAAVSATGAFGFAAELGGS